jgi:lysophospholipase L1-like esterase
LTYPGLTSTGLLVRNQNAPCAFGSTAFTVVPPPAIPAQRVDPSVLATNVAVPGQSIVSANTVKWVPQPTNAAEYLVFVILGIPYVAVGGTPATQVETAAGLQPTFVSLWLGGNDALGAATSADASLLTPNAAFNANADQLFATLAANGARGIVANVPDVTVVAHLFSQADIIVLAAGAGLPLTPAQAELLTGVKKKDYVPLTQMPAVLTSLLGGGPLGENQILRANEVKKIKKAVKKYNKKIAALARANDWPVVDAFSILNEYDRSGVNVGGETLTTNYLGGIFGLDGVHPTNTGHALVASAFIQAINAKYGTSLPLPDIAAIMANDPDVCVDDSKRALTLEDVAAMAAAGEGARAVLTGHLGRH